MHCTLGSDSKQSSAASGSAARTLSICQARKALQLAVDFGVEGERRATPMTPAAYGELRAARDGDELADKERFQSGLGSLQHLAQCTRPDIAVVVGAFASFSSAPTAAHYDAMLDVVRYVGATATRGITYGGATATRGITYGGSWTIEDAVGL